MPEPATIEAHRHDRLYADGTWAVVSIDPATLRARAKRINITMPERILDAVDRCAQRRGETRSGLLVRAVTEFIDRSANGGAPALATTPARADRRKKTRKPNARNLKRKG